MTMQAQWGDGGIAPPTRNLGARRRWVVSTKLRPLYRKRCSWSI